MVTTDAATLSGTQPMSLKAFWKPARRRFSADAAHDSGQGDGLDLRP
jgi:hypothetical protein